MPQPLRNPWPALLIVCLGFFMIMLDTTIVYVATPSILTSLQTSLDSVLWVFNGYLLAYAVLLITAGRLGDLFGPRNLFAAGLVIFTAASVLCGLSQDAGQLIAARVVQGVGGALLAPQSLAILTSIFPRERMGAALGFWGAVIGVSTLAGPTLGGFIVTNFDWRWIFFVNVPIGIVALVGAFLVVPDVRPGRLHRFDLVGVALSGVALLAIVYALIEGQRYDWGTISGIISIPLILAVGVVLFVAFLAWERSQAEPLVPLRLFNHRNYTLMNGTSLAVAFAMQGIFLPFTIYLQSVRGMSALDAGLAVAPLSLVSMFVAPFSGRLADRFGGKYFLMAGLVLFATGTGLLFVLASLDSTWQTFVAPLMVAGLGMGCVFAPMTAVAMKDVAMRDTGAASGVFNTMRQLGAVVGSAVIGAVLQAQLAIDLPAQAAAKSGQLPPQFRDQFVNGFAQASRSGFQVGVGQSGGAHLPANVPAQAVAQIQQIARDVFENAFILAMHPTAVVAIVVLLLAAAGCVFIAAGRRTADLPERMVAAAAD
ncbi:MAG TPA: DHA2 family efflux MFS transporter permease subunit [Candidatus Limnocylindria bacterium]|nr:DHA2 family efflux MFS transporter permease subunit [Candidatus Limnocylindria bacterium]